MHCTFCKAINVKNVRFVRLKMYEKNVHFVRLKMYKKMYFCKPKNVQKNVCCVRLKMYEKIVIFLSVNGLFGQLYCHQKF